MNNVHYQIWQSEANPSSAILILETLLSEILICGPSFTHFFSFVVDFRKERGRKKFVWTAVSLHFQVEPGFLF